MLRLWSLSALALALWAGPALAHVGIAGHVHGFSDGFSHPFGGLDHLLAMTGVGLWAGAAGGRAAWAWPAAFVAAMAVGGGLAIAGVALPFAEAAILLSLAALVAAFLFRLRPAVSVGAAACALFALAHGFAHGAEAPAGANGLAYAAGFLTATALLHLAGLGLAAALRRRANGEGLLGA